MKHSLKHLPRNNKIPIAYAAGGILLLLSVILGIFSGATRLDPAGLLTAIFSGNMDSPQVRILLYVRLPRVWGTVICGAALAVAGAVIQQVLCNRLASPSIIGVNAGAGLAVTVCSAAGILGGWRLSLLAFLGALISVSLVSLGAKRWGTSKGTVILMGVALNSLLGAFSDAIRTLVPDVSLQTTHFRIGDFSSVTYRGLIPATALILPTLLLLLTLSNRLDVLTLGDHTAGGLGMRTSRARMLFLFLSALLAGVAVSVCGLLSFVGLLIPHGVRLALGPACGESRRLIPLCALFGGGFVALCDTLSRVIFAPYEIPVGILMALLGAPLFLFILLRGKGEKNHAGDL